MHVEVHLVAKAELFHQLPQLLQGVEQAHASTSVEVVGLDQPYVLAHVHFVVHCELAGYRIFVFHFRLYVLILHYRLVYLHKLLVVFLGSQHVALGWALRLYTHLLDDVEILTEAVNFADEVF